MGSFAIGITVVEFSDAATANGFTETLETTGLLRNFDGKQHLGLFAHCGPLGDMPKPVEINVGAAIDRHEALTLDTVFRDVLLHPSNCEAAGRLDDRPRVFEDVADCGADLVGVDRDEFVDMLPTQAKRLVANAAHRNAVGENADMIEGNRFAGGKRLLHSGRVLGLYTDDPDVRPL